MRLDLTSFAFGFTINGSNGNPNWATALGQGLRYKINPGDSINEILKGIVYSSVPLSLVRAKIGKGGREYDGTDPDSGIVLGGVFDKVYANGIAVPDCKLVIILTRDMTLSHEGRLRLKYSPHNTVVRADGSVDVLNAAQFDRIRNALGLSTNACWFVYEMKVIDQDQLHLSVGIANANTNVSYASTADLHDQWNNIIVSAEETSAVFLTADELHQRIVYGAPGTGKSHKIKKETAAWERENVFRTTFHPDSDYSTFVGAYKPTMKSEQRINCIDDKAKAVKDADNKPSMQEVISYEFVAQAFTKTYVKAWQEMSVAVNDENGKSKPNPVFLVIEEINRGNCAQIFGDLFQLLDRNDAGYSDYPIDADTDLARYLAKDECLGNIKADELAAKHGIDADLARQICTGRKMVLPPNLFIRATMNTSDQSLFPIDSAFKRRWDWEYVPILEGTDEQGNSLGWMIEFEIPKSTQEDTGEKETFAYSWWDFVQKVNEIIGSTTKSEDKKLGYFFVKADGKKISAKKFLEKVIFYLWNDVFKDFGLDKIFVKDDKAVEFTRFFDAKTGAIDLALIKEFVEYVRDAKAE